MNQVAVIGLDSVELHFAEQLMQEGKMPHLAALRRRGAWCTLRSESTWRAGRVWESFLTGDADFPSATWFDPKDYSSHQVGARRVKPFYAKIAGLRTLAIDVPYMTLAFDVPGAQVVWGGHDTGYPRASRPAGLVRQIDARFGAHPSFLNDFSVAWHDERAINTLADATLTGLRRRLEVVGWLMERVPDWDLFMTVFQEAHSTGEMFWHGLAPEGHPLHGMPHAEVARRRLVESHQHVDRALGETMAMLPKDATVVACSVHGMELNHYDTPSMAMLPELLYRDAFGQGLFQGPDVARWKARGCPTIVPEPWQKWDDWMMAHFAHTRGAWRWKNLKNRLRSRFGWRKAVERLTQVSPPETTLTPEQIGVPSEPVTGQPTAWYRQYWPRMRAFALPVFYDGRIRINLKGREARGIVERGDYEAECTRLENLLHECRDTRTGKPAIAAIERLRRADPFAPDGPDADLVITWAQGIDCLTHPRLGDIGPMPFRRTGSHTDRGFACIAGPGIEAQDLGCQEALDLTPTVVELLGAEPSRPGLVRRASAVKVPRVGNTLTA